MWACHRSQSFYYSNVIQYTILSSIATASPVRTAEIPTLITKIDQIHFCEFLYDDLSTQSHEQLNNLVYSNICCYILNTACNTSYMKPPKIISHDHRLTTLLVSDFIGRASKEICQGYWWLLLTYSASVTTGELGWVKQSIGTKALAELSACW